MYIQSGQAADRLYQEPLILSWESLENGFIAVVLNQGQRFPPRDTWQCMETSLVVTAEWGRRNVLWAGGR